MSNAQRKPSMYDLLDDLQAATDAYEAAGGMLGAITDREKELVQGAEEKAYNKGRDDAESDMKADYDDKGLIDPARLEDFIAQLRHRRDVSGLDAGLDYIERFEDELHYLEGVAA